MWRALVDVVFSWFYTGDDKGAIGTKQAQLEFIVVALCPRLISVSLTTQPPKVPT
jgi:hypothetical protein